MYQFKYGEKRLLWVQAPLQGWGSFPTLAFAEQPVMLSPYLALTPHLKA